MKMRGAWAVSILWLASVGCADDDADADVDGRMLDQQDAASGSSEERSARSEQQDEESEQQLDESHSDSDPDVDKDSDKKASGDAIKTASAESAGAEEDEKSKADDKKSKADMSQEKAAQSDSPAQGAGADETATGSAAEPQPGDTEDSGASAEESTPTQQSGSQTQTQTQEPEQPPAAMQATLVGLGERLFEDKSLSLTGTQSCASCHDAQSAFSGNADSERPHFPVARGATEGRFGTRNSPTAMYMQFSPAFSFVEEEEEPGEFTPTGGLFWDGRVNSLSEQAAGPFLNPREMAQPDKAAVVERVREAEYVWMFEPLFGPEPLSDVDLAYEHVTDAIAAYERTDKFNPFSSKFDAYLRGEAELSEAEQWGFTLFQDPEKGNCISCHVGTADSTDPREWLFTDFTYDNLGVPRNSEIPDNADSAYFDLGLCQSEVVAQHIPEVIEDKEAFVASLCGAFKVPTLRNVERTSPYMHNGYFLELRDVVDFYATRETDPAKWYPQDDDGSVTKYNDLPGQYWDNVNTSEAPYDRAEGEEARLTSEEIDAIVSFLEALTDGYHNESHVFPHVH